jgi:hypothetical protein
MCSATGYPVIEAGLVNVAGRVPTNRDLVLDNFSGWRSR